MRTSCTHCGTHFNVPDKTLGKQARCKSCGKMFVLTPASAPEPVPMQEVSATPPRQRRASDARPKRPSRPGPPVQTQPEAYDPLDALAGAAIESGADFSPAPRAGSSPRRPGREGEDEDRGRGRRVAKGASLAMTLGVTALVMGVLGGVCLVIAMVQKDDQSLLITLGLVGIGLLLLGGVLAMMAVVNGSTAMKQIRLARHPLAGKSEASTGSLTGTIALGVVFACAVTMGIYLANSGGIQFKEVVDTQGNVVTEDDAQNTSDADLIFFGSGFLLVIIIGSVLCAGFWIWMLIDSCTKKFTNDTDKIIWVLVILLTGVVGAIIYLIFGRPKPIRKRRYT